MSEIEKDGFVTIANDAESVQKANKYDRTIKDRQGNVAVDAAQDRQEAIQSLQRGAQL